MSDRLYKLDVEAIKRDHYPAILRKPEYIVYIGEEGEGVDSEVGLIVNNGDPIGFFPRKYLLKLPGGTHPVRDFILYQLNYHNGQMVKWRDKLDEFDQEHKR